MEPLGDPLGSTDWVLRDGYHANGLPVIEPLQLRLWADVIGLANLGWDNSLPSRSHGRPHEHHLAGSLQDFFHKCKMLSRSPKIAIPWRSAFLLYSLYGLRGGRRRREHQRILQ
jgi:hypothetical protein